MFPQNKNKHIRSLQDGGISTFVLGIILCLVVLYLIGASGNQRETSQQAISDTISTLSQSQPSHFNQMVNSPISLGLVATLPIFNVS